MTSVGAARVSLGVGAAVLGAKLVAWRLTGSVALYSDALESVVNVVAAVVAMTALHVAALPADENHPWGHSKAEYFSAGAEGVLVVVAALAIVRAAVDRLVHPAHLGQVAEGAAVAVAASAANLVLGLWLRRVGRKNGSPALVADGTHVLTDVLTTAGVLVGIGLARATGIGTIDPVLALLVGGQIIVAGVRIVRGSVGGLMDESVPGREIERLRAAVRRSMGDALQFHDLRARRAGARLFVELHLVVPGEMSVRRSHELCDLVERAVEEDVPGAEVTIHVEPETERRPDGDEARA